MLFNGSKKDPEDTQVEDNRRSFWRVSAEGIVDYRVLEDDAPTQALQGARGLIQNISGGGICLEMSEDPGIGRMMALDIRLPEVPSTVISLGRVKWSKPLEDGGFEVGVEFWWVGWESASAQETIRSFISDNLRPEDQPPEG